MKISLENIIKKLCLFTLVGLSTLSLSNAIAENNENLKKTLEISKNNVQINYQKVTDYMEAKPNRFFEILGNAKDYTAFFKDTNSRWSFSIISSNNVKITETIHPNDGKPECFIIPYGEKEISDYTILVDDDLMSAAKKSIFLYYPSKRHYDRVIVEKISEGVYALTNQKKENELPQGLVDREQALFVNDLSLWVKIDSLSLEKGINFMGNNINDYFQIK